MRTPILPISGLGITLAISAGLPLVGGVARAADTPSATAASVPTPFATAKTIRLKETFSVGSPKDAPTPIYSLVGEVEKSNGDEKIRFDMDSLRKPTADRPRPKTSIYLLDGVKEYEYNGLINKYTISDAPAAGKRSHSQLRDMTSIDFALHPDLTYAAQVPGITRTVTSETLDGKAMHLTTWTMPARKGQNGKSSTVSFRLYVDAVTGLPYRRQDCITPEGEPTWINMQTDFSGWEINPPIEGVRFAWNPPAGSSENTGPELLAKGTVAPDFTAFAPDGTPVKLSSLKGKVVILDFWATWCGPCQKSMPHLEKVYSQVKDKDVAVLAVCVWDKKDEYDKWLVAKKGVYSFPTVFDPAGRAEGNIAGGLYKVTGIPTQYVIDKDGKIAGGSIGYSGDDDHKLEATLATLGINVPTTTQTASAN